MNIINSFLSHLHREFNLEKDIELTVTLEKGTPLMPLITSLTWLLNVKEAAGCLSLRC